MKRWDMFSQFARSGNKNEPGAGYTIVEIVIVLAVSTGIFLAVVVAFRGRQSAVEFTQVLRNYESKILSMISDVNNGYSDYNGAITCNGVPVGGQGTNEDCVFLGRLIGVNANESVIYSVIGNRTQVIGGVSKDIEQISAANPRALYDSVAAAPIQYRFNTIARRMFVMDAAGGNLQEIGSFGFMSQIGGGVDAASSISGSRTTNLYYINGGTIATPIATLATNVNGATLLPAPNGIRICMRSESRAVDQNKAEIIVGGRLSATDTKVTIGGGPGSLNSECLRDD